MADAQPSPPSRLPDWEAFYRDYRKPGYVPGFEVTTKLGGGAFGLVFRARKESIGKDYAIKFLQVEDSEVRQAVLRELEQVKYFAQVDHPNLVQIEDRGEVDGIPYLVMQFAGTETLRDRLPTGEPPNAELRDELLRYFLQACRGVAALHERSLVHFDLKPANVFLKGPVARVGDYGLSKLVTHSRGSLTMGRGTPYYMSPEMLQRRGDHRSDVYSLGVMLYEILCGRLPFTGDSEWEVLRKHETEQPVFPDHLTAADRAVLQRCLQKDPAVRFQSVHDLITALGAPAGVAAAAWDDVRSGVGAPDGPPPLPPPLPPAGGEAAADARRGDEEDPYAGFRKASGEAYRHARKIAREAMATAREISQKAGKKARELMGEQMRRTREQQRRSWQQWREHRSRRRAERHAARQQRHAESSGRRRWVWMLLAVPFAVVGGLAVLALTLAPARVHRSGQVTIARASSASGPETWVTYPGVMPNGRHFLFDQWSVPGDLRKHVAFTEPPWVSTFRRDRDAAARELHAHWTRLKSKAPLTAPSRRRQYELPQFQLFGPDPRHLGDIQQLLAGREYDRAVASRIAKDAPRSLAAVAVQLDKLRYSEPGDVERARRLHRLLTEATGFEEIQIADDRRMSLAQMRKANAQLGDVWLWFLHEVAITERTWETFRQLHGR